MTGADRRVLLDPLLDNNPIALQILGICSALAVTTTLATAITMSLALTVVLTLSCGIISVIRNQVPRSVRLIVQITIIASLVVVVDQFLKAYAFEMSKRLSVFVSLIVTNCIVLRRTEGYAMQHGLKHSLLDGLGNGLGYSLVLILVGAVRELLGFGTLLGADVLPLVADGGWFHPVALMLMPPGAFFIIGLLIWGLRACKRAQIEPSELPQTALMLEDDMEAAGGGSARPIR